MRPKRPLVVPIVGALNVFFGVVGVVGITIVLLKTDAFVPEWTAALAGIYVLTKSAALLLAGVGLLLSRRWGRVFLLLCGWWGLLEAVAGVFVGSWMILVVGQGVGVEEVALLGLQTVLRGLFASIDLVVGYLPSVRRFFNQAGGVTAVPEPAA